MNIEGMELDGVAHTFITYGTLVVEVDVLPPYFDVIAIVNQEKQNGDFDSFLSDIGRFCIDNGLTLRFRDVNTRLANHLVLKRGGELVVHL